MTNVRKLKAAMKEARRCLNCIATYSREPQEIVYDKWAYDRMRACYKDAAVRGLSAMRAIMRGRLKP